MLPAMPAPRALPLLGLAVFAFGLATTVPLPLYPEYAAGWSATAFAGAFALYALTLIVTAPFLGPLPDRIGRKPCVLLGLLLSALATLGLALVPTVPMLALARMLQGLAMGCIAGAAAAWGAELSGGGDAARRAAATVTTATAGSFGAGALLTLLVLAVEPAQRPPVTFWLQVGLALALIPVLARLPETLGTPAPGWLRRPAFPPGTVATTLPMLAAWGSTGTMLTAVPAVLAASGHPQLGAVAVAVMILVGVAVQQALRGLDPRRSVRVGLLLLTAGLALAVPGALAESLWLLLAGGSLMGAAGYGFVYLGGLAAAVAAAAPEERARATAGFFLVAHCGFSLVPLSVGIAVDAAGAPAALWGLLLLVAGFSAALWPRLRS
jgi:predicted MFS family arabinose efflux permease